MLRIRLVLWYSFLVVLTVAAVGAVQYALLYRSLANDLDTALLEDAKTALHLISNRPSKHFSAENSHTHTNYSSKTLKQLVDDAIKDSPDSISGQDLTDRVLSSLMDEMLGELSGKDSGAAPDPFDALVQRTLTSRRNDLLEIYSLQPDGRRIAVPIFRTQNLGVDTIRNLYSIRQLGANDSARTLGEIELKSEALRAAVASNKQYVVFAAYTETDIWDVISRSQKTYLFVLPIALLIATFGGIVLARKALKPIEDIANTAQDIGAKNLSRRIEMPPRGDRELTSLVNTLNSMISRIEGSFNQIAQFSSDASHELKTPLAILKGEIEHAQRKIGAVHQLESGEAQQILSSLMEEVERMQRIVEGLLLLAKADDHRLPLAKENISLYSFLDSIAEDAEILAADRGLDFQKNFDDNTKGIHIDADPIFLYQVMMNLLDNAFKYTPWGGKVSLFMNKSGDLISFGVEDNGPGIAPNDMKKIFRRFYRTEQARTHQGAEHTARSLGLGLAIVKSIVEAHGGSIMLESELGKGSKFIVKFHEK
jgi:two-component system OmpR family sensor kinase